MTRACSFVVVALLLFATSCSRCAGGDDAGRAAAERAHVQAKQASSLTLAPYKAVKLLWRSKGAPDRPAAWDKLDDAIAATRDDVKTAAGAYGALAKSLVTARGELLGHDEDEFPLLWTVAMPQQPVPATWYDNGSEHLALATAWVVLDFADGATAKKVPAHDVIFYEAFRSKPAAQWPRALRAWSQLLSGVAYAQGDHHYAAEEDLTAYLATIESEPIQEPLVFAKLNVPANEAHKGLRAAGHFARAWNRMGMNRDDAAAEDLKEALKDLEGLGIDNELTQWAWAFVHAQQGNYAESAVQLEKLAQSPHLDEKTRAEIRADAKALGENKKVPVLGKAKAAAILGQALLKRGGGLEHILDVIVGSEEAAKPIAWLKGSRDQLAQNVGGAAKDLAGSKLDAIKQAVKELTDAGP
jgi:hypothetical protein